MCKTKLRAFNYSDKLKDKHGKKCGKKESGESIRNAAYKTFYNGKATPPITCK